jgi:hypothetical protein
MWRKVIVSGSLKNLTGVQLIPVTTLSGHLNDNAATRACLQLKFAMKGSMTLSISKISGRSRDLKELRSKKRSKSESESESDEPKKLLTSVSYASIPCAGWWSGHMEGMRIM